MLLPVLALLIGCVDGGSRGPRDSDLDTDDMDDTGIVDTADTAPDDSDTADTAAEGAPTGPTAARLPFAVVGDAPPSVTVTFAFPEGATAPAFETTGPFAWSGDDGPVAVGGSRAITVTLDGGTAGIRLVDGTLTAESDGVWHTVRLSAVVARPGLPSASWAVDGHVRTTTIALATAPYPDGNSTWTDPSVLVVVPEGLRGRPGVVTHLHGHSARLSTTVPAHHLVEQFDLAARNAVLVIPQGPYDAASGDFGKLMDAGGHKALVDDVLALAWRDGWLDSPVPDAQVVTSHSGGYQATAALVDRGGYGIDAAHLFDSVYAHEVDFAAFAEAGGLLRSSYTSGGGTVDDNAQLTGLLDAASVPWADTFDDVTLHTVDAVVGPSASSHNGCVWEGRAFARWLEESGLPPHAQAPPEVLATTATGGTATVTWRVDRGSAGRRVRVEGSTDGLAWSTIGEGTTGSATVAPRPWLRVRGVASDGTVSRPSDVYGATGSSWLVVDGFDRVLDGSWGSPTHPFAARVGGALGDPFSVASNEAVGQGLVDLADFDGVIWLLGDESTGDVPFAADEKAAIEAYVGSQGRFVASGSEIGYAAGAWMATALHATYVADDAGTTTAGGFQFGVAYPEDYPDVVSGQATLWTYATGGAAAVVWDGRVAVVGFPLETLADADLAPALESLKGAVGAP